MNKFDFENRLSRVCELNGERLKRAFQIMTKDTKVLLDLIPIFLHFNDPAVPGYSSKEVPFGIDCFEPNEFQKQYIKMHGLDVGSKVKGKYSIYGLFTMGSTSSIAQSKKSDLDIWVCISKNVPNYEISLLSEKCNFISSYAKALGSEVNLFVTVENRFTSGQYGIMDTEDCGSAQSLFLLDEFYRSCIRICGRHIAWFMVSPEEEYENYQKYIGEFYKADYIQKDNWFDFGSVAKCSPVEYFGSGLWLVYKGIDHPLKAVLKILLMEAYADEFPNTRLLSIELKLAIYERKTYSLGLDPYYLMLKKVEKFLIRKQDYERLHLAKVCFYLKVRQSINNLSKSSLLQQRKIFLRRLCLVWGWKKAFVDKLDNIERWKISIVQKTQVSLLNSLLESYKALIRFSVSHKIEYAITSDDAGVLSRKIYSSIDVYPGKIVVVNKEFIPLLEEETISLIESSKGSLCQNGWYIYTSPMNEPEIISSKPAFIGANAVESIAWATFNNLLSSRTNLFVSSNKDYFDSAKIKALSTDISNFFNLGDLVIGQADLKKPREIVKALIIINFEKDATQDFLITPSDLEIGSSLSCGRQKMCLVGSIDILTLNSWGEVNCNSYPVGEMGVLEVLALIIRPQFLRNSKDASDIFEKMKICSYSKFHSDLIRYDLEATIRGILSCFNEYEHNYLFTVARDTYEAKVDKEEKISIYRHSLFRASDDDVTILSRFGMRPEYALQVPHLIERHASAGVIQYFFHKKENSWDIYIVNERNEVKIYNSYNGSRTRLVNAINRFYTQESDNNQSVLNFNLPQYFVLSEDQKHIHPFTIFNR